jgi:cell division protein FtsB
MNYRHHLNRAREHMTLNNGVLLVAVLIGSTWAWSTIEAIQRNFKLQQQVDSINQQIAVQDLENKSQALQNQYYQSPEYLELSARERLNKAAPDEKVIMLPGNKVLPSPEEQLQATETPITSRSNFAQWMYFLFGKKGEG